MRMNWSNPSDSSYKLNHPGVESWMKSFSALAGWMSNVTHITHWRICAEISSVGREKLAGEWNHK
jgi:hypothetical protein